MRLAWLTDVHLNFVDEAQVVALAKVIEDAQPDAVLIGGDIAEAPDFEQYLTRLESLLSAAIYFVLGNHDYYRGSIAAVRSRAESLTESSSKIHWLPARGVVQLSSATALVGHGGWGDARVGDFLKSDVVLNDYVLIDELRATHDYPVRGEALTVELMHKLQELGDESAAYFDAILPAAFEKSRHVVALMHVPPFHEACLHEGNLADLNWAPHFVCAAAGLKMKEIVARHPDKRLTVLCGHTHSSGYAALLENLEVMTGAATYGSPEIQQVLEVD